MSIQQLNLNSFYDQSKQRDMWVSVHVSVRAKWCQNVFAVLRALVALGWAPAALRLRLAPASRPPSPKAQGAVQRPTFCIHPERWYVQAVFDLIVAGDAHVEVVQHEHLELRGLFLTFRLALPSSGRWAASSCDV